MFPKVNLTLKLRIFLTLSVFYLATLGALTYFTIELDKNQLIGQMHARATSGIKLMELSVVAPLYKFDVSELNTLAKEAKTQPDVQYVYVYDSEGRILGDSSVDVKTFTILTDELSQRIIKSNETMVHIDYDEGILDISKPVTLGHQKLGGIRIGFDLDPMLAGIRKAALTSVAIGTSIFLIGLFIIFGIAKKMTSPIQELTEGVKRIEKGDYRYRVSLERKDELGTLAKAFNQMAERLMRREVELKESQDIIRRADRLSSLGQLTAGLAHEIRNPLVAIRTFTQLLPERYEDKEFRNDFQAVALREVDRICGLVSDLLSFARPSRPNVAAENVNEIVEGTVRLLETEAKEKGVEMRQGLAPNLPKILVDKEQIKQVLMNIVLNAIQSIKGDGFVEISTEHFNGNGKEGCVRIGIRDSGVGIPEKDVVSIFDPFFTTKKDGSGLGLSISHQIIKEHGGQILVMSAIGTGTCFYIDLPVKAQE